MDKIWIPFELIKKETSCVTSTTLIRFAEYKKLDIESFLDGIPYPYEYLTDNKKWILHKYTKIMYKRLNDMLDNPNGCFEAGLFSSRTNSLGIIDILAKLFLNPTTGYKHCESISWKFNRIYRMTPEEVTKTKAIIKVKYFPEFEAIKEGCDYTKGILTTSPVRWKLPKAKITELQCQTEGADSCIYEINYKEKRNFFVNMIHFTFGRTHYINEAIKELEENYQLLEQKMDEVTELNITLEKRIVDTTEKNIKIIKEKSELERRLIMQRFSGSAAHGLKNGFEAQRTFISAIMGIGLDKDLSVDYLCEILNAMKEKLDERYHPLINDTIKKGRSISSALSNVLEIINNDMNNLEKLLNYNSVYERVYTTERLNIKKAVENSIRIYQKMYYDNGIQIKTKIHDNLEIIGNRWAFDQIFSNLIKNACDELIKTEKDSRYCLIECNPIKIGSYEFKVIDNGQGIQIEPVEKIWEPYISTKLNQRGFGLGLPTVKSLIEKAYNGDIYCQTKILEGAEFIFILNDNKD
jgi:signal transduction histidine kinase